MKLLEELTTVEEMVQALQENSIKYNCKITGFEAHKDTYIKNDVSVTWWDYRSRQKPADMVITCSSQEEQEHVYANWWLAIEKAGGKIRKVYEKEKEEAAKRRDESRLEEFPDWVKALGIY
ncbi:hypothetical protein [Priestia megaterium]|uniref:hypothetical protein n=1 Tax=Priestia megaterium TaxID=1404 RepID=UPI000BF498B5|nr:hypothetical protein [Priestia megaterium]PFD96553.1 hypothetical protein CN265_23165 [Priestia megaterium]